MKEEKKQLDLVKNCSKLFIRLDNTQVKEIPQSERVGYMDNCNVCMIVPKFEHVKQLIINSFDVTESKVPDLDYNTDEDKPTTSKYSSEYLKILLEMSKHSETIKLSIKHEYPLKAECDEFIFILAPKIVEE